MTGNLLLDWALLAVSLLNTILLLWLGLTVLLTAERRTWGVWLAGGGLLAGGAFFVSHTAILGHYLAGISRMADLWWRMGWLPLVALPYAWYGLMLWYAGFWNDAASRLHRRHLPWLILTTTLTAGLVGLVAARSFPSLWQVLALDLAAGLAVAGIPLLLALYPVYVLLCMGFALAALRRPGPSARAMGDLARRRARPWLVGASAALLAAALLATAAMSWIVVEAPRELTRQGYPAVAQVVAWFDLVIASLISAAVVLVGQAIVSYEIFTGRTLPRRGFLRHWHRAVVLATGYSLVIGWSLAAVLRPIYALLLTALVMTAFYALLVWRTFVERERSMAQLRPFAASQRLVERLVGSPAGAAEVDAQTLFCALCEQVLGARLAYLLPAGHAALLAGPPLVYPPGTAGPPSRPLTLTRPLPTRAVCLAVEPESHGGATWAVPLWSERGLIGVLLLGDKRDGGLYSQEEIEVARAGGERLVDVQASAEMARRLMALQRQRLAEDQMTDQRTRRVLHDEVLPRLHAALLTLSDPASLTEGLALLAQTHRQIADLLREMPSAVAPEVARLGLVGALRRVVEEEMGAAFDRVAWQVEPEAEQAVRQIAPFAAEALYYAGREAIRNAARHGRGPAGDRALSLTIGLVWQDGLLLTVEDDGAGVRPAAGQNGEGAGQGLALHSTLMAVVGGSLIVESAPGAGTRVALSLPAAAQGIRRYATEAGSGVR